MDASFALRLGLLAGLLAYLCINVARRWRAQDAKWLAEQSAQRAREKQFLPTHISALAPQVRLLRHHHFALVHSRPHLAFYRRGLIAAALRLVRSLSYFRHPRSDHQA